MKKQETKCGLSV